MTRRTFLETIGAGLLVPVSTLQPARAAVVSASSEAVAGVPWTAARTILRSGRLGTLLWGQVSAPPDAAISDDALAPLLIAMDVREQPQRVTTLEADSAPSLVPSSTTIVEFASAPPVYVTPGPRLAWTIRGTRARLHVRGGRVRVVACSV